MHVYITLHIVDELDDIGGYDEASIRYKGRNIPSKSFKILQNMTGGPASASGEGFFIFAVKWKGVTSHKS